MHVRAYICIHIDMCIHTCVYVYYIYICILIYTYSYTAGKKRIRIAKYELISS